MHINKKIVLTLLFVSLITVATAATWAFNFASTSTDNNVIYATSNNPASITISSTSSGSTNFFTLNGAVNDAKIHPLGTVNVYNNGQVDGPLFLSSFVDNGLSSDLVIYYGVTDYNVWPYVTTYTPLYIGSNVDKNGLTAADLAANPILLNPDLPVYSSQPVYLYYEYVSTAQDQTPGISLGQFKVGFKLTTAVDTKAKNV